MRKEERDQYKRNNERGVYKTEFEAPLQEFLKSLTHANRAANPGMIRCILDDRLKRSPKGNALRLYLFCE